ncbi:MAG: Uma2 family endonuclease [Archangium sp.]|nr:Uma2 family endonuclease [Archangium sp.]
MVGSPKRGANRLIRRLGISRVRGQPNHARRDPRAWSPVHPLLAVEIAGQNEDEDMLLVKARWYFKHGVKTVWLVLPETRGVIFLRGMRNPRRLKMGDPDSGRP